jgi:ankyrin repeat protein
MKTAASCRANPNWMDYDGRCPLHIAASQGSLPAVQLMVEVRGRLAVTQTPPHPS